MTRPGAVEFVKQGAWLCMQCGGAQLYIWQRIRRKAAHSPRRHSAGDVRVAERV